MNCCLQFSRSHCWEQGFRIQPAAAAILDWVLCWASALGPTALGSKLRLQPFCTRNSGPKSRVEVSALWLLWASNTGLSTKEKKKVRLNLILQILFLFPGNCDGALLVTVIFISLLIYFYFWIYQERTIRVSQYFWSWKFKNKIWRKENSRSCLNEGEILSISNSRKFTLQKSLVYSLCVANTF